MIWATVKMILALGGILVLLFCLVRVFKRWEWGGEVRDRMEGSGFSAAS